MKSIKPPSLLFRAATCGGLTISAAVLAQPSMAAADIKPAYQTNFSEVPVKLPAGAPSTGSFGYFFDTNYSNMRLNALGFPIFAGWANTTASPTTFPQASKFDVYLWRIDGINQPSMDACNGSTPYCQVAKVTFDQDLTHTYTVKDGYYWQDITPVNLGGASVADVDLQYATVAVGNFSLADGLPTLQGGNGTFDPAFSWTGNGFNSPTPYYTPDYSAEFPVPWNFVSDPASAEDPTTFYAYFSPNLSYALVPSPLPLLGAGTAFAWARRIRRRVGSRSRYALG
ncbi:MAG: hypothetical protein ACK522_01770 [Synechococcaceae cyanobacterium]